MLSEICPVSWKLKVSSSKTSVSQLNGRELRVLETEARDGTELELAYEGLPQEINILLVDYNSVRGIYQAFKLPQFIIGLVSLDTTHWQFEPYWRFLDPSIEITRTAEDGYLAATLRLKNVSS
jgi:hypothetical protein